MTMRTSFKMYLTIFLTTTCVYMVLYQYHFSRAAILPPQDNEIKVVVASKSDNDNNHITVDTNNEQQEKHRQQYEHHSQHHEQYNNKNPYHNHNHEQEQQNEQLNVKHVKKLKSEQNDKNSNENDQKKSNNRTSRNSKKQLNVIFWSKVNHSDHNTLDIGEEISVKMSETDATRTTLGTLSLKTATSSTRNFYASSTSASSSASSDIKTFPPLYIITPTYRRPEQLAEITRLGYTLKHVTNLLWLVIEDAELPSTLVTNRLKHIGVPFEHLIAPMPVKYRKSKAIPRGVSNRNRGLQWLRANATDGVFYFADDDNTYDVSIFEQMRYTKKVSMWPVGLVTKLGVSSPILKNGQLIGFYDGWIGGRKYPVDMAGFSVSVKFLLERPKAEMPYKGGYEEDGFLKSLAPLNNSEIQFLASDCTEILTWHTQTKKNENGAKLNLTKYDNTNLVELTKNFVLK